MNISKPGFFKRAAVAATLCLIFFLSPQASAITQQCEDICFPRQNNGLFSCNRSCGSNIDKLMLPSGFEFLARKTQTELRAPIVKSAEVTPERVSPGGAVRISIKMEKDADPDDLPFVSVYYSNDDTNAWRSVKAGYNPEKKVFEALFVAPVDVKKIIWFVRAISQDENAYIEVPCEIKAFPFLSADCLLPLAGDSSYADYEDFKVDPALDILRAKTGEDANNYYFLYVTAEDVDGGDKLKSLAFVYIVGITDPAEWTRLEPLNNTAFLVYAPELYDSAKCAITSERDGKDWFINSDNLVCQTAPCSLVSRRGQRWVSDPSAVQCVAERNMIMFKVKKKRLMQFKNGYFETFLGSNAVMNDESSVIKDYTGKTAVRRIRREIIVGGNAPDDQPDK